MDPTQPRCLNCFAVVAGPSGRAETCPTCGWRAGQDNEPPALPRGLPLNGCYRLGRVLGHGGFGITYLAWDENLALPVAIKEFLPLPLASRGGDRVSVAVRAGAARAQFADGLERFLEEARALARFDQHPSIVGVKTFFRAHGTGYMVMEYIDGITLAAYLERHGGRLPFATARDILMHVMDALRACHQTEPPLLHRDIAPDNIYLTRGGRVILLDFGAARQAVRDQSQDLSRIFKPGYAPWEQCRSAGRQGPWTDVYGVAATLYRAITGAPPPEAPDRIDEDNLQPPSTLGIAIAPLAEAALLAALTVRPATRTQEIAILQRGLTGEVPVPVPPPPSGPPPSPPPAESASPTPPKAPLAIAPAPTPVRQSRRAILILVGLLVGIMGSLGGYTLWQKVKADRLIAVAALKADLPARMAAIPAGCFNMGSPEGEAGRQKDETHHRVCVGAFGMGKYEVTFAEYDLYCSVTDCKKPSDEGWGRGDRPVINVSWYDATAYAKWVSEITGERYRLPTEAEWEYAARAGTTTAYWWGDAKGSGHANCYGCGSEWEDKQTAPVGSFPANPYGLYDTVGNAWEWVCSATGGYDGRRELSCEIENDYGHRMQRGGSFADAPPTVRAAYRGMSASAKRKGNFDKHSDYGFRLAKD